MSSRECVIPHPENSNMFVHEDCGRPFHVSCILGWSRIGHTKCPICRRTFRYPDHYDDLEITAIESDEVSIGKESHIYSYPFHLLWNGCICPSAARHYFIRWWPCSVCYKQKGFHQWRSVLQREIEERGKEIHSLVRRCEQSTPDGTTTAHHPARRYVLHLERSWHHIWIRSLENQCLTEQHLLAVTSPHPKDSPELDSDEGPLRKHRRLAVDHWTTVAATMDKLNRTTGAALRTRDVGVLCSERVPVNDKCIMVGTTGIAALKAEYGDDFTNFEIIQDVGYSSESSTHLSGDDAGLEQHFNVRIYKYSKDGQPTSLDLREGFESSTLPRAFPSLGSSLESSSSAAASLDDSGLGTGEALTNGDSADIADQFRADDEFGQDDLDYLETVLDECVDFGASISSEPEELHFPLSGLDSDDSSDNFHNRSSFTSSAQVFYKMISVDSDNGETENNNNNEIGNIPQDVVLDRNLNISTVTVTNYNTNSSTTITDSNKNISSLTIENSSVSDSFTLDNGATLNASVSDDAKKTTKCASSDSDPETFKPVVQESSSDWGRGPQVPHRIFCSTPIRSGLVPHRNQSLKRKRDSDVLDATRMSSRVRSWLNRCSDFSIPSRHRIRPALRTSPDLPQTFPAEDISSCDASCEYTSSSSADEGNNVYSSMSSFGEDDVFRQNKSRVDSGSAEGSVETVLHALLDSDCPFLLPPPPSSSASFGSGSKICSTVCCQTNSRGRHLKASSDGELRKRSSRKEVSNLPGSLVVQRLILSKTRTDPRLRLYSSLPNVLRHLSDSSTDDYLIPSTLPSHSDSKTTGCFNHSSSSEVGRRRRRRSRKKSTSSNRSSTSALLSSGDRGRLRSRTGTSSSRCGSRRRNASQRSDFLCPAVLSSDEEKNSPLKVEIPPEAESVGFDDLRRASSALLSPVESDVVLTHLEEQSTVSDQVWDGYQEMPYLSEGYSEATVDEDAVRKLTEFGDDYGSAIGLPLRLLDPPDGNNNKTEFSKSPKKLSKSIPVVQRVSSISDDSDSDSEDLNYVIEETDKALHFAKSILRRRQGGEPLTSADYAELLATCGTHLRCLQTICKHIDGKEHNFSDNHLQQLRHRIEQWLELKRNTEMFETLDGPARQKYLKARENIDALFGKMSQIASCSNLNTETFYSWDDVEKHLSRLQMVLTSLMKAKEQLLSVNLQVHRFTTEYGSDINYKDCSLKDDVTELYRQWEDIYEQNGAHLTELEALKSDWEAYEDKFQRLRLKEQEIESRINEDCDNKSAKLTEDESDRLRRDLEEVKRCAASLSSRLKGGDAWKKIDEELEDLKQRIDRRETRLRKKRTYPSENRRCSSSLVEDDADDHFEDAIQILCEGKDRSSFSTPQKKDTTPAESPKHKRGRFWRIVRIAVPVQLALVILYCIACCLEPGCCNTLNNFNLSFTPQLRYFGGRPPV